MVSEKMNSEKYMDFEERLNQLSTRFHWGGPPGIVSGPPVGAGYAFMIPAKAEGTGAPGGPGGDGAFIW